MLFPDVYSAILDRFSEGDVSTGNGRIDLIIKYAIPWNETLSTLLFGIGLYVCHTHCAPLLYLFGIGIFGVLILAALELRYIRLIKGKNRVGIKGWVPFIATLFMKVVGLRGNTFSNMPFLTEVSLPDSITEIRGQAFKNCRSLERRCV